LLSEIEGLSVGSLNFNHHLGDSFSLFSLLEVLNLVLLSDIVKKLESLLFSHFLLAHAETFTLLDLVDDNFSAAVLGIFTADLAVFLFLEILQAFNFHHEVKLLLLAYPFFLELLRLDELLVADGDNFGVENHLVHFLDIVLLFVHEGLGLGQKSFDTLHIDGLLCSRRQSGSTEVIVTFHDRFTSVVASTGLFQLGLSESLMLLLLLSRDNLA